MKSWKLWGCFASLALVVLLGSAAVLYACADGGNEFALYVGLFRPDLSELKGREAAYFYPDAILAEWETDAERENIDDWKRFLPGATDEDVRAFVYTMPVQTLHQLRVDVLSRRVPRVHERNAFIEHIIGKKDLPLLDYVLFARESAAFFEVKNPWDYKAPDAARGSELFDRARKSYNAASSPFLKTRYWYQSLRALHAIGDDEGVIELYEATVAKMPAHSPLLAWSRSLYAGALYQSGDYARAYAEFARVFEASTRYRVSALLGGRWVAQKGGAGTARAALQRMATPEDRARVLALTAYLEYGDASKLIAEIAEITPKNPELEVLVAREINKLESLLQPLENESAKSALLQVAAMEKIVSGLRSRSENPAYWGTAAAYLACLRGDFNASRQLLASIGRKNQTPKIAQQLEVLSLFLDIKTLPLDDAGEAKLLASLRPLAERIAKQPMDKRTTVPLAYADRAFAHLVGHVLSDRYAREGRVDKEIATILLPQRLTRFVFLPEPTFHGGAFQRMQRATPAEMEKLRRYAFDPKTEYDRFLLEDFPYTFVQLTEIAGTRFLDARDFQGAANVFTQIKGKRDGEALLAFDEPGGAFSGEVTVKGLPTDGGKRAFAEAMAQLEGRAKNPKSDEDYRAAYVYAKGLYNMGSCGNSWELSQYELSTYYRRVPPKERPESEFYTANAARKMFERVAKRARDPELRARALFMASLSLQQTTEWNYDKGVPTGSYFTDNPYFKELKKRYASTRFYEDAVESCSYLHDFK